MTSYVYTIRQNLVIHPSSLIPFGVVDQKGREIGARITLGVCDHIAIDESEIPKGGRYRDVAPGHKFMLLVHATRDGSTFGASQSWRLFTSENDRAAALEKYLADARKRAGAKA